MTIGPCRRTSMAKAASSWPVTNRARSWPSDSASQDARKFARTLCSRLVVSCIRCLLSSLRGGVGQRVIVFFFRGGGIVVSETRVRSYPSSASILREARRRPEDHVRCPHHLPTCFTACV